MSPLKQKTNNDGNDPKTSKPFYKRWWFFALTVLTVLTAIAVVGATMPKSPDTEQKAVSESPEKPVAEPEKPTTEATTAPIEEAAQKVEDEESKAVALAMDRFACKIEELSVEKLADAAFLVNLVDTTGGGTSTLDSILVVDKAIADQRFDDKGTMEAFDANVARYRGEETAQGQTAVSAPAPPAQLDPTKANWNTENLDVWTNKNIKIAKGFLAKDTTGQFYANAVPVTGAELSQKLWQYYGHYLTVSGEVSFATSMPPGSKDAKFWSDGSEVTEVHIVTGDMQQVVYYFQGSTNTLNIGDNVEISGFPVGIVTGETLGGGSVQMPVLVGK